MKIIFMGTPDFTLPILDSIVRAGHRIELLVTQPDRPVGRTQRMSHPVAYEWAFSKGIPTFQPERIADESSIEELGKYEADIFVVAAFGQILPKEILTMPRYGCVNVHASLLPKYRGASPIQWAILNGDLVTGVTIMQMGEGLDDGDILLQKEVFISPRDTGGILFDKLAHLGGDALIEALEQIEAGSITPVPQDESEATRVGKIDRSLGRLDFNMDAATLVHYVRGLNPWPGAYTTFRGKKIKIHEAEAMTQEESAEANLFESERILKARNGEVVYTSAKTFYIKAGTGCFMPVRIQEEGKKIMMVSDYLRGHSVVCGDMFGEE